MIKTRPVTNSLYTNHFKKAAEYFEAAKDAMEKRRWNAVVVNSVHSGISSADALTVFFKGFRHAGERHEDAISLLKSLDFDPSEANNKSRQLQRLLQVKNSAEYEEKLMSQQDAENSLKDAERFFEWVKEKLPSRD